MPPTSRKQQRFVFARARAGEKWAQKWVREGQMRVVKHRLKSGGKRGRRRSR